MANEYLCHIDHETQNRLMDALAARCAADWVIDLHAYVPRLVDLLIGSHDQPIRHFEVAIRQIVRESAHCDDGGDACVCDPHHLDHRVHLLLEVLEEIRLERQQQSHWADVPVTPLMCG